jgi:hypothetical protein
MPLTNFLLASVQTLIFFSVVLQNLSKQLEFLPLLHLLKHNVNWQFNLLVPTSQQEGGIIPLAFIPLTVLTSLPLLLPTFPRLIVMRMASAQQFLKGQSSPLFNLLPPTYLSLTLCVPKQGIMQVP